MRALWASVVASSCVAWVGPAHATEWTAPYLGAFIGYGDANDAWDQHDGPGDPKISPEGIVVGGFGGYTQNLQGFVIGAEADVVFPDFGDAAECETGIDCAVDVRVLSSLRGRIGVAIDTFQIYGAGGLALGFVQAESSVSGASESASLSGWTLGGGIEYAAPQGFRLGVEYRHSDFGEANVTLGPAAGDVSLELDEVRLRLSFGFD